MSFSSAGYQLLPVLPELVLAVGAMALLMLGAYRGEGTTRLVTTLAVVLLVVTGALELMLPAGKLTTFGGSFIVDDFARFLKILAIIGSAVTLILSTEFLSDPSRRIFEYSILVLLSTLGMMVLISAADLIMLYLGLELMSLALYVVAASNRDNAKSTEAGLKYFVLGALSSGMLLYGASLIYGFTGTVEFAGIAAAVKTGSIGIVFGLVFLLAGLCFKVSAVPFHMWTPDVYEGAPTPVTAFFASAPKVAALAVFTRVTLTAFPGIVPQWQQILVFVAIASMALGSFAAIGQKNIKRLMAYSSIGHMGFALVGLASGTVEGAQGVLVYIAIYVAMTLGTFAVILSMKRDGQPMEQISDFSGPVAHQPAAGVLLRHAAVLAGGHSAARGLLRQMVRVRGRDQGGPVHAGRHRRAHQRGGRVLLSDHHQGDVFRRAGRRDRTDAHRTAHGAGGRRHLQHLLLRLPGAAGQRRHGGGEVVLLRMTFTLGPTAISAGYGLAAFDQIGSTNAEAMSRARDGERGPIWFVTTEQTAGRGRRQRAWIAPRGNLASSVLEVMDVSPGVAATLGFAAGLSLESALQKAQHRSQFSPCRRGAAEICLKWPNDVMADGQKLAGILLEAEAVAGDRLAVVVGIGTNVIAAPEGTPTPATSLAALGVNVGAEEVFTALSEAWVEFRGIWDNGRGFAEIRRLWLERAFGLGERVAIQTGTATVEGTFDTIDEAGCLIVRTAEGKRVPITAGEVYFGAAASVGAA